MQRTLLLALMGFALSAPALAGSVKVENAWVRATAPGQQVAGGFMDLTASADMKLVGGSSPASDTLELHIMKMENGVMEMRQVKDIALPKGKTVSLKPGGLHVMFIGIQQPIREGDKVPVTLIIKDRNGHEEKLSVVAEGHTGSMQHHH